MPLDLLFPKGTLLFSRNFYARFLFLAGELFFIELDSSQHFSYPLYNLDCQNRIQSYLHSGELKFAAWYYCFCWMWECWEFPWWERNWQKGKIYDFKTTSCCVWEHTSNGRISLRYIDGILIGFLTVNIKFLYLIHAKLYNIFINRFHKLAKKDEKKISFQNYYHSHFSLFNNKGIKNGSDLYHYWCILMIFCNDLMSQN